MSSLNRSISTNSHKGICREILWTRRVEVLSTSMTTIEIQTGAKVTIILFDHRWAEENFGHETLAIETEIPIFAGAH